VAAATGAVAAVLGAGLLVPASAQVGGEAVEYRPPVDAPVTDPFRPPPQPWLPGNRGVEYATVPGTPVRAAGRGEVTFAGAVGGDLHVTVTHPDGVRTSYSFLAEVSVVAGQHVERGHVVGTAGSRLHVGARRGDTYIDPESLWGPTGPPWVRLAPLEGGGRRVPPLGGRVARSLPLGRSVVPDDVGDLLHRLGRPW
jgi:murein DD-endopeptidase MepM/ murein hydrolase activator NlpD